MPNPDHFTTYLQELLAPLGPVAARRMFGGVGLFHNGLMFGLIVREELFLKVGDANRPAYQEAGEAPFSYLTRHGSHTISSYWRCPPNLLDEADAFLIWARAALDAAVQARPKPAKPKGARLPPGAQEQTAARERQPTKTRAARSAKRSGRAP